MKAPSASAAPPSRHAPQPQRGEAPYPHADAQDTGPGCQPGGVHRLMQWARIGLRETALPLSLGAMAGALAPPEPYHMPLLTGGVLGAAAVTRAHVGNYSLVLTSAVATALVRQNLGPAAALLTGPCLGLGVSLRLLAEPRLKIAAVSMALALMSTCPVHRGILIGSGAVAAVTGLLLDRVLGAPRPNGGVAGLSLVSVMAGMAAVDSLLHLNISPRAEINMAALLMLVSCKAGAAAFIKYADVVSFPLYLAGCLALLMVPVRTASGERGYIDLSGPILPISLVGLVAKRLGLWGGRQGGHGRA